MKKILLIDDEVDFLRITKLNLAETGEYEVFTAANGREGIEIAKSKKPDLILLDVLMPDMDGGDVAAALEDDVSTKDIPIVFVTAVAKKDEVDAGGGLIGGRPFLAKPVNAKELCEYIKKILG